MQQGSVTARENFKKYRFIFSINGSDEMHVVLKAPDFWRATVMFGNILQSKYPDAEIYDFDIKIFKED